MSAVGQALKLASRAGPSLAAKVMFGLAKMHWRYFVFGRGRGLAKLLPLAAPMKVHVDPAERLQFQMLLLSASRPGLAASGGRGVPLHDSAAVSKAGG